MKDLIKEMPNTPLAIREFVRVHIDDMVPGFNGKLQPLICSLRLLDNKCKGIGENMRNKLNDSSMPWLFSPASYNEALRTNEKVGSQEMADHLRFIRVVDEYICDTLLPSVFGRIYAEDAITQAGKTITASSRQV